MIINIITVLLSTGLVVLCHGSEYEWVINAVIMGLIGGGLFVFFGAGIGVLRLPDFYTRVHAAGKGDTLSSCMILGGVAIHVLNQGHISVASVLVAIKILLIINFIFIGSPTATHAIIDAGYKTEIKHWSKEESK